MGWSMDRHGIQTLFDQESKLLKQVELSGPRRERVSLDTYADALAAREAEFRQEAKYGGVDRVLFRCKGNRWTVGISKNWRMVTLTDC